MLRKIIAVSRTFPINRYNASNIVDNLKKMKIKPHDRSKTEIVSLTSNELNQLATLENYSAAVSYLENHKVQKSYQHMLFSLNQARSKYPESIALHMCLMNRQAILERLLGQNQKMSKNLQEIFLMSLSLKGEKSLQTKKHLNNYLISLVWNDPIKANDVLNFIKQQKLSYLQKRASIFEGIITFLTGQTDKGIQILNQYLSSNENQIFERFYATNNLGWFKLLQISQMTLQPNAVKESLRLNEIKTLLLRSLLSSQQKSNQGVKQQISHNLNLQSLINSYLQSKDGNKQHLLKIHPKTKLQGSDSHIIAINIAYCFFFEKNFDVAIKFMKLGLQKSIEQGQPQRLGMGLILLSKLNFINKSQWQNIVLDMLDHIDIYSPGIKKQCLLTYGKLLFVQTRYYQSEDIIQQSAKIEGNIFNEGLLIPTYDFSY